MTQTARRIARAFKEGRALRVKNTITDGQSVHHHGHCIAFRSASTGTISANMCGWGTVTTRDRLNAIHREFNQYGIGFSQRDFGQFYNGKPIGVYDTVTIRACGVEE